MQSNKLGMINRGKYGLYILLAKGITQIQILHSECHSADSRKSILTQPYASTDVYSVWPVSRSLLFTECKKCKCQSVNQKRNNHNVISLSRSSCVSPVELTDGRGGEEVGGGAKSYDSEKAWSSFNHSILSGRNLSRQ